MCHIAVEPDDHELYVYIDGFAIRGVRTVHQSYVENLPKIGWWLTVAKTTGKQSFREIFIEFVNRPECTTCERWFARGLIVSIGIRSTDEAEPLVIKTLLLFLILS